MNARLWLIAAMLLMTAAAGAQPAPDTLWTQRYGGELNEYGSAITETADSGFAIAGQYATSPFVGFQISMWKASASGSPQWQRIYEIGYAETIISIPDNGYVVGGSSGDSPSNGTRDFLLIKTNEAGIQQWRRTYGGSRSERCSDVIRSRDGGYVLVGQTDVAGTWGVFIVKTDSGGELSWQRTFSFSSYSEANVVVETQDGDYLLGGCIGSVCAVLRLNALGDTLWSRTFGDYEPIITGVQLPDSGFFVCSSQRLLRLAANGDTLWTRPFYGGVTDMLLNIDNSCTVVGNRYMARVSLTGDSIWYRWFTGFGNSLLESVVRTWDGGYAVAGYTQQPYPPWSADVWVLRTEEDLLTAQGFLAMVRPTQSTIPNLSWDASTIECPQTQSAWFHLKNFGSEAIVVFQPLEPSSGEFSRTTSCGSFLALAPGQMSACSLQLVFDPTADGTYYDTLLIQSDAINAVNGYVRIPLAGTQISTPAAPQVVIQMQGTDARLYWPPVTLSIGGCPVATTGYLVFYSSRNDSTYEYHGFTTDTSYVHTRVAQFAAGMFYKVVTYTGPLARAAAMARGMGEAEVMRALREEE